MVAIAAVAHLNGVVKRGNADRLKFESEFRQEQQKQLDELKNSGSSQEDKIKELETKLQSKLDEKARLAAVQAAEAAKPTVVEKVVAKVVPHAQAAVSGSEAEAKMWIYMHESGNNPNAVNKSSGACGLAQALPCSKMACSLGDYACQDAWATQYMKARYGTWLNAKAFWLSHKWW